MKMLENVSEINNDEQRDGHFLVIETSSCPVPTGKNIREYNGEKKGSEIQQHMNMQCFS